MVTDYFRTGQLIVWPFILMATALQQALLIMWSRSALHARLFKFVLVIIVAIVVVHIANVIGKHDF